MSDMAVDKITATPDGMRVFQQERLILDVTERLCELMEQNGVSRAELAHRLKKSKGYITQLLSGSTNMTLRTVSDLFLALGKGVRFGDCDVSETVRPTHVIRVDWAKAGAARAMNYRVERPGPSKRPPTLSGIG